MAKILTIESTHNNIPITSALLNKLIPGSQVTTAQSGTEGIAKAKTGSPDVILLDIDTTDLDGYEVCNRLKGDEATAHIPVILVTAFRTDTASRIKGLEFGADAFLAKSVDKAELVAQVNAALRIKNAEDRLRKEKKLQEQVAKERTEELKKSEERYRAMFENISTCVAVYRAVNDGEDFVFLDFNRSAERAEKIKKDALIGKSVSKVFPGVKGFGLFDVFQRVWKTGKPEHHPIKMYRDQRISGWRENFVYRLPSGEIVAVYSDVTERKQAEEKLKESLQTSADIVRSIPSGLFIYQYKKSKQLILLDANPPAEKFLGFNVKDWIGKEFNTLWPEAESQGLTQALLNASETRSPYQSEGFFYKDKSVEGTFRIRAFPIPGDRLGVAFEDISKRKQAEDERKKLQIQLQQAQKMEAIGTLAGGIAHDFNNILSAIFGFTELALGDIKQGSPLQGYLQEVLTAGGRAKDLVQQILTFSRQTEQELKPVQVKLVVKEALKLLRASLPTTINIRQKIRSDALVTSDPTQIHQILMNLCTNAGYAMQEKGGMLAVELADIELDSLHGVTHVDLEPGPYVRLTVSDTGHGMSQEVIDRIFDPFFTTKPREEGTGMGLSVVHGIVKSHRGTIMVQSEPGKGTMFEVYLPAAERLLKSEVKAEEEIPTGTGHILFVDDEAALVKIGKHVLTSLGYKVTTKTSSTDALELFQNQPDAYDAVITDMTMPNLTGDKLAKELLSIRPETPIILCTGFSPGITKERVKKMGIRALVAKPILKRELAKALREVLG